MDHSLHARLFTGAHPDAVALQVADGTQLTYEALAVLSGRIAAAMDAQGVRPGDRVMTQVAKSPQAVALYLATLRLGAIFVPLNPAYTSAELDYFLTDADPALVVADPDKGTALIDLATAAGRRLLTLSAAGEGSLVQDCGHATPDPVTREAGDIAAILYTSGTTGKPKGAMLTHANLTSNAQALVAAWRITAEDTLIHALPIFHVHGLFVALHTMMLAGGRIFLHSRFDLDAVLDDLPHATMLMGVPTFYARLLQSPRLDPALCRGMRLFVSGSAPLLEQTHREFADRTGHAILERYGMTETGMNTSNPYEGSRRPGTVGFPLPGTELRIRDGATDLSAGEIGAIEVRGPNVFAGYWRNPEKTRAEFAEDGFFKTGDLGMIDTGGYVHIVGRAKDLIISGGYNVYPKEVEAALDALPGVAESAVIGLADPDLGECVCAVIVAEDGAPPPDGETVIAELRRSLAPYKIPRRIVVEPSLPRNAMGKVQKALLRQQFSG